MATKYKALLVAPDGSFVCDYYNSDSKEQVIDRLANQGSKRYFYPFEFVIVDPGYYTTADVLMRQHIVDAAPPYECLKGKTVRKALKYIEENPVED